MLASLWLPNNHQLVYSTLPKAAHDLLMKINNYCILGMIPCCLPHTCLAISQSQCIGRKTPQVIVTKDRHYYAVIIKFHNKCWEVFGCQITSMWYPALPKAAQDLLWNLKITAFPQMIYVICLTLTQSSPFHKVIAFPGRRQSLL